MPDPVPFYRLDLNEDEIAAVAGVLRSGWLTSGGEGRAFEQEFAAAIGSGVEAVALNSATAGLHLALEALGVGPGDEVIVPTLTFTATAEAVRYLGAHPVFADVDPDTLCLTAAGAEARIGPRTRAIMPVHFAGLACDMTALGALARRTGVAIVEDAAHALPASHGNRPVGAHGSAATVFSFYANKTLTTGEGGMLVSADPAIVARARLTRLHGIDKDAFGRLNSVPVRGRYDVVAPGFKYNLTDIAATLGRMQLKRVEAMHAARAAVAARYDAALADLPLVLPAHAPAGAQHAWHLYVVRLRPEADRSRDELLAHLEAQRVGYAIHYLPLHRMTYWRERYGLGDAAFPVATACGAACVSLPLFPSMRPDEVERVVDAVRTAFA